MKAPYSFITRSTGCPLDRGSLLDHGFRAQSPYFFPIPKGRRKKGSNVFGGHAMQIILSTIFRMRDKQSNHTVIGLYCKSFLIYLIFWPCLKFIFLLKKTKNKTKRNNLLGLQSEN